MSVLFINEQRQQMQSLFHTDAINLLFVSNIREVVASSGEMLFFGFELEFWEKKCSY